MPKSAEPIRVLFVCLGNICRSPLAEGIFRHLVRERGLEDRFEIDSAGTSAYHIGEPPDRRSTEVARRRGILLTGSARRIESEDLLHYDYVLAMDAQNLRDVRALAAAAGPAAEVRLLRDFDPETDGGGDVPDPYFGGSRGFEEVHDIVERSCRALLDHILARHPA